MRQTWRMRSSSSTSQRRGMSKMSGIKQIFNKEMARIFKDKKMVFSVFLLPVLIMVVILSIVNGLASNMRMISNPM